MIEIKRLIKTVLPIEIGMDLTEAEEVRLLFKQGDIRLEFVYPSETAQLATEGNVINTIWSQENTASFKKGRVLLDTFIKLGNSEFNPQTEITSFEMSETLFRRGDFVDD